MCKMLKESLGNLCIFHNTVLKKGQKTPKEKAIIMHFNIITYFFRLSRGILNFSGKFLKKLFFARENPRKLNLGQKQKNPPRK